MKSPAPSAYVTEFYEYMTEVPNRTGGTGSTNYGKYKLHKTLGQAKNSVLGRRGTIGVLGEGDSAIYKWNEEKDSWALLYVCNDQNPKPWENS